MKQVVTKAEFERFLAACKNPRAPSQNLIDSVKKKSASR